MASIGASRVAETLEFHMDGMIDWLHGEMLEERRELERMLATRHQDLLRRFKYVPRLVKTENDPFVCEDAHIQHEEPPLAKDMIVLPGMIPVIPDVVAPKPLQISQSNTSASLNGMSITKTVKDILDEVSDEDLRVNFSENMSASSRAIGLDVISAIVILLYIAMVAFKAQYKGIALAHLLSADVAQFRDSKPPEEVWPHAQDIFDGLEWCFVCFFITELALRIIWKIRLKQDLYWNIFDTGIIILFFVEMILPLEKLYKFNPTVMRMVRLLKLMRLLKLVRYVRSFDALHLIVKSIASTMSVLGFAVALIFMLMVFLAVVQASLLSTFIGDVNQDPEIRRQAFLKWGSFWRALLSMFEITLANWGPHCWFLVNNVSEMWGAFFIVWRCVVGFAVIQVISSVFIQHTFKTASRDEDVMIQEKIKASEYTLKHLDNLFTKLDNNGDGFFKLEELEEALEDPRVKNWFAALEISVSDAPSLFRMIDKESGDGKVHKDEFMKMLRQMRGGANRLDMLQVMDDCQQIRASLNALGPQLPVVHVAARHMS